ncbi:perlucin-like protein [Diadema setosum]|uniref:perlucin-like protein n=1 Tax=Diadema setosum TaxID=31175 RepID=UPI003B3ACBFB
MCPTIFSGKAGGYVKLTPKYVPLDHPSYDVMVPREARGKANLYCAHPAPCPAGWSPRDLKNESCYLYRNDSLSWTAARDSCVQLGGYLVAFQTPEEMTSVLEYLTSMLGSDGANSFWTGLNDCSEEGTFTWTTVGGALPLSSSMWKSGEPNDSGYAEDCTQALGNKLNDKSCGALLKYVCEFHI